MPNGQNITSIILPCSIEITEDVNMGPHRLYNHGVIDSSRFDRKKLSSFRYFCDRHATKS